MIQQNGEGPTLGSGPEISGGLTYKEATPSPAPLSYKEIL